MFTLLCFFALLQTANVSAQTFDEEYFRRIQVVQKHIEHVQSQKLDFVNSLTTTLEDKANPLYKGLQWSVLTMPFEQRESQREYSSKLKPLCFNFEVTDVNSRQESTVKIEQIIKKNERFADQKVEHIEILMNAHMQIKNQRIFYRDRNLISDQIGSNHFFVDLTIFPIQIPSPTRMQSLQLTEEPKFPESLKHFFSNDIFKNMSEISEFHYSDAYARPIKALWKRSDYWPLYLETSAGISIKSGDRKCAVE